MQFMVMGAMSQTADAKNWHQTGITESNGPNSYGGKAATPRGRGGYGGSYGNARNNHSGWAQHQSDVDNQPTDAIVLGGGGMDEDISVTESTISQSQSGDSGTRSGGKMQKVGDKWVFVRTNGSS